MELYLNTYGSYLRRKNGLFEVQIDKVKKQFSAEKISSIIISNAALITTDAIQLALEYNIDILFLDEYGDAYGRIWFPKLGSTTLIRRKLLTYTEEEAGLEAIQYWMLRKMYNQYQFIELLLSKRTNIKQSYQENLSRIRQLMRKVYECSGTLSTSSGSLMGWEGNTSKIYFTILSELIPERFHFEGRSSRPAKDAFNAFLNYGYGVLYGKVEKALIIAGLDPYIGLLHADNYNKKSLVFDFIEPYRYLIDQTVFYMFSRHKVNETHTDNIKNGVSLNTNGKQLLLPMLLETFDEKVRFKNKNNKRIDLIQLEAHAFANYLIGKRTDYKESATWDKILSIVKVIDDKPKESADANMGDV